MINLAFASFEQTRPSYCESDNAAAAYNMEASKLRDFMGEAEMKQMKEDIVVQKAAEFVVESFEWYCSGNVTCISISFPISAPINWSSNPGINAPEPITKKELK